MSIQWFSGTTPAGKAERSLRVNKEDDHVAIAIYSAGGNFMADIRLDIDESRRVGVLLDPPSARAGRDNRAAEVADELEFSQQGGAA